MSRLEQRRSAVADTIEQIREVMANGPEIDNLETGKAALIALAARSDLFNFDEFPLPTDDAMECSYLVHAFDDGSYSLYVNSAAAHQYYAPHDHGNAWAIIAGVQGRERHRLYLKTGTDDHDNLLVSKGEIIVSPGEAVTMQPDGIHEVNAMDQSPLLHLHLYAADFELQGERWKYDLQRNLAEPFMLDELGSITDAR